MQQTYTRLAGKIRRTVSLHTGSHDTTIADLADANLPAQAAWWQSYLRGSPLLTVADRPPLRVVDAFSGAGGLALGVKLAAEAAGRPAEFIAAIDTDAVALEVHRHNLGTRRTIATSVASLVDYHVLGYGEEAAFGYEPEIVYPELAGVGRVDMFIAGPPCQGHSNLNNHTRRQDPRNELYVKAAAAGVALKAEVILLENVPTVLNSYSEVVATAVGLLKTSGYSTSMAVLKADELGASQRRSRHFLLAIRSKELKENYLSATASAFATPATPVSFAIGDLVDRPADGIMDTSPTLTPVNAARIDYLFDHDEHDLPDDQRPQCHRNGTTYTAVYGRMYWDRPAQTVTTGFGTPGQGRYIHPLRRRVITPREAARIQGFPECFDFTPASIPPKRKNLTKWIGDAVHPILGYTAALSALEAIGREKAHEVMKAA